MIFFLNCVVWNKKLTLFVVSVCRFTSSDTQVESVVLQVRVLDSAGSGVVELGSAPLVVPLFYGLSNAIDGSVLNIRTSADLVCIVRLMTVDTSVPALGQLVREEDSTQRKGTSQRHSRTETHTGSNSVEVNCFVKDKKLL